MIEHLGGLMRRTTTAAVLLVGLLAAGCSSGDDGDDGKSGAESTPAPAVSSTAPSTSEPAAAPTLSKEWQPKLDAATAGDHDDVCKTVGSTACVTYITELAEVVYDVRDAIDTAGATAAYPKTMDAIQDVEDASAGYAEGGCAGSSEATLAEGSVCGGYVATLLTGPGIVSLTMTTDELTAS
ncbi:MULTISPECIES: hypothetical protein [Streptomyces rochei group]|uniref:hypothetical protein n=1 Tax=Streptomyces rochei group TaxID=2867164 RepID=UPI001876AE97|nr:hypothetical protein [Streptomyces vinaceusdrappus]GHC36762.1 hypothetical protein GCM10010308_64040 [Streptomyces vinaceusdrappus]